MIPPFAHDARSACHPSSAGRRTARAATMWEPVDSSTLALIGRIAAEYREMPGLTLTAAQAARLFGIDRESCDEALEALVAEGRLRRSTDHRYYSSGSPWRARRLG